MTRPATVFAAVVACSLVLVQAAMGQGLKTRWAEKVDPAAPLQEYPRPQFEREQWMNLNGRWEWSVAQKDEKPPVGKSLGGSIVVPYPIESSLSGVGEHHDRIWYRRTFEVPRDWEGQRVLLNFGAVDYEAVVYVNGREVGSHRGGYDAFSFDISPALTGSGPQELLVGVYDPTDEGQQPRGKQVRKPEGIWYTPCTGIWQTVWIEPVPHERLRSVEIVPDLSHGVFKLKVVQPLAPDGPGGQDVLTVRVVAGGQQVQEHTGRSNQWMVIKPGKPHPWSPDDPFLYDIIIEQHRGGKIIDVVKTYAGLRSVTLGKDKKGRTAILLNGEPVFQVGPLDQGFWPDGIYTAPTDEALRYDIEVTKQLGFNMTRKHVKVEPERWYYWADKLGLLVWQDMPSSEPYIGPSDPDATRSKESKDVYEKELEALIAGRGNHPSIIMWVPFNEGWGQFETARIVDRVRALDPTRLVDNASGWSDRGVGDVIDWHRYPEPASPAPEAKRAAVLGEFGGLGLAVEGHTWKKENWGYKGMKDGGQLTRTYEKYLQDAYALHESQGLSAVVYTQITDVEVECNGLLTYDRAVIKPDVARVSAANRGDFSKIPPPPVEHVVVPTSQKQGQAWRYTIEKPKDGWEQVSFDDTSWKEGKGGFGSRGTPGAAVGTEWSTPHIWARRSFDLDSVPSKDLMLRLHHDEDCEVYINGVQVYKQSGFTTTYEDMPLSPAALAALHPGKNILAVSCSQTRGGQYIDAGLVTVTDPSVPAFPKNALPEHAGGLLAEPPTGGPNLAPSPGFSGIKAGETPRGWRTSTWDGQGHMTTSATEGRDGTPCVKIESATGGDIAWSASVPVQMKAQYELSGWIRTKGVAPAQGGKGALLNVHGIDEARTEAVGGDSDWTHVSVRFDTGMNDSVQINCLFGGWGTSTGSAWYDDVELRQVRLSTLEPPKIRIDAGVEGEKVSPYVYGQFIEHLGRCIYGGIWAEMLEDRKFFYDVGAKESPWMAMDGSTVVMSTAQPFVGAHTPEIKGGMVQKGLAVEPGKTYTGRIWLAGESSAAPVRIRLSSPGWGDVHPEVVLPAISKDFTSWPLSFSIDASVPAANDVSLEISSGGTGSFRVGTVSLMPSDNVDGFRSDTLALLKELNSPVYRWPGGNFVSGYDWRDGIGDRDRRPPRKNPAWTGVEHNDVGIHEFMHLCELLHAEPYVAINTGLGSVQNAVAELQYANGSAATSMGALRARNGHEKPWEVKFWGIGNEMYGDWQLGHVPLAEYLARHASYVTAMRAEDPSIKVVGVGAVGEWSKAMLRENAGTLDYLSEHVYWQGRDGLASHVLQAPESLGRIAGAHRGYRKELGSLKGRDIRIVQDEWNYWYGPDIFGELGTRYYVKDALGVAAGLHEFVRNSDLFFMANYAQTVNVIGAIKTTKTRAQLETTGEVLKLYRARLGTIPVKIEAGPLVDAVACWNVDHTRLTLAIVNPTLAPATIPVTLAHASWGGAGTGYRIAGDPMAFNDPGSEPKVRIEEFPVGAPTDSVSVAPCSVTLLDLPARKTP